MKKSLTVAAIGGGVVTVILLLAFHGSTQYSLYVDARTESGDGITESHVTILNAGTTSITNLNVDYGGYSDKISILKPGDRVILSPPTSSKMVTVTDDQGVTVTKSFSQTNE